MKRRFAVRAAVAATGALALAAGTAGAHPIDFGTTSDSWINSGVGVHWNSHGAAGAVPGRQSVPAQQYGLNLVGKSDLGGKLAGAGRVADVSAKGDYAYLTMFYEPTSGRGGVQIVNIADPANPKAPKKLVEGAGDFTKKDGSASGGVPQTKANETHSAFAWEQRDAAGKKTGRVYVVLVDDLEEPDVDILDISNPSKPKLVS